MWTGKQGTELWFEPEKKWDCLGRKVGSDVHGLGLGLMASKLNDQLEWEKQVRKWRNAQIGITSVWYWKPRKWGVSGRRKWPAGLGTLPRTQRKCEQVALVTKVLVMVVNAAAGSGCRGSGLEGAEEWLTGAETRQGVNPAFRNLGNGAKRDISNQGDVGQTEFIFVLFIRWNDWRMCNKTLTKKKCSPCPRGWWEEHDASAVVEDETCTIRDFSFSASRKSGHLQTVRRFRRDGWIFEERKACRVLCGELGQP